MAEKTILVVPDLQVPFHNREAVQSLTAFAKELQPDVLVCVGDDVDAPEVSQWHRGLAGEYAGTLQASLDEVAAVHAALRAAIGDAPYHLSRSNHGDRLRRYIARFAPALAGLRSLDIAELAGYKAAGIEYHASPFGIAPGWVCAHGDEGGLSQIAGRTASMLSQRWGVSVVCGHTHRGGLIPTSTGFGGAVSRTLWGMEVGHMMDVAQAQWLPGGHAQWQTAFGLLRVREEKVHPELIPVQADGTFCVDGQWWPAPPPRVDLVDDMEIRPFNGGFIQCHAPTRCAGRACALHNPSDHSMSSWRLHWRQDRGLMERLCRHGVGHPDPDDVAYKVRSGRGDSAGVHGCDGCCRERTAA